MEKPAQVPVDPALLDLIRSYQFLRRYKILRPLGQGGMGLVLLAEDRESGDKVAVKVLLGEVSERSLKRFQREARTLLVLNHPGTVSLRDYGIEPRPFLVMDYIEGKSLKEAVDESLKFEGRVPDLNETVTLFSQLTETLRYCHDKGLLHRDIKPANIVLGANNRAVLVDFGLVKRNMKNSSVIEGYTQKLSMTGEVVGTVSYMSPEQLEDSRNLGPASDVWSLGASLYYALTGELPFEYRSMTEFISAKLNSEPQSARKHNPELPQWLDELCLACLKRQPEDRLTLIEFEEKLKQAGKKPRSMKFIIVTVLLLFAVCLSVFLVPKEEPLAWKLLQARKQWTKEESVDFVGKTLALDAQLRINDIPVTLDDKGAFQFSCPLKEGENKVTVTLRRDNKTVTESFLVFRDNEPPQLVSTARKVGRFSVVPGTDWQGRIDDQSLARFEVNGFTQSLREGQFRVSFPDGLKAYEMNWSAVDKVELKSTGQALVLSEATAQAAVKALRDRASWALLDERLQDFVAQSVAKELGENFEWLGCENFQCEDLAHRLAVFRHKKTGILFHLIPGGRFILGAPDLKEELEFCLANQRDYPRQWIYREKAQRELLIPPFLVARTELSLRQWHTVADGQTPEKRADWPVAGLTFLQFKSWLTRAGDGLRLPSEAEWEYFCRAGSRTRFYWGNELSSEYAWTRENTNDAHSVLEHKKTNAFGLVDTLGNVKEWCEDHWSNTYASGPKDHRPRLRKDTALRVYRGGSYNRYVSKGRVTYRNGMSETESKQNFDVGIRVVLSLPRQ